MLRQVQIQHIHVVRGEDQLIIITQVVQHNTEDAFFDIALDIGKVFIAVIEAILFRQQKNYLDALLELEKAALIVDSGGNGYRARYIYDVLNETSQKLHSQPNYEYLKEKLNKESINNDNPAFINGKIVSSKELDDAMVKNLKSCGTTEKLWDLEE